MKPARRLNLLLAFPLLLGLWACSTATASPSAAFTQTFPAFTPPAAASTARPTATEWLPYNPNIVSDDRCEKLVATTLPVAGTEGMTNEEIVQRLFAIYLEKHLTLPPHHICRLENYRIEKTTSDSSIDFLAKEQGVDFVNWVIYSVQISEVPSSFVAGNGVFAADGWIVRKALIVGVTKVNDEYVLKLLGTGP